LKKLLAVFALVASCGLAAEWSGYVVDKSCASKKAMWGNEQCAQSCIKRGDPAVFVTADGKIYQIAEQDKVKSRRRQEGDHHRQNGRRHDQRRHRES